VKLVTDFIFRLVHQQTVSQSRDLLSAKSPEQWTPVPQTSTSSAPVGHALTGHGAVFQLLEERLRQRARTCHPVLPAKRALLLGSLVLCGLEAWDHRGRGASRWLRRGLGSVYFQLYTFY
jgi:hypothetical protein